MLAYFNSRGYATPNDKLALPSLSRSHVPSSPRKQMVTEVFNMFDQDGSGEIELEEIAKAFETMGKLTKETREQLKAHFEFMDRDGSGEVNFDEFRAALGYGGMTLRNYQQQQVYNSLGLDLCQNLVVYRRRVLHQQFENLNKSGPGALMDQFECLVKALLMSTFTLNLMRGKEEETGATKGGKKGALGVQNIPKGNEVDPLSKEVRALNHVLRTGQRRRQVGRPLPISRQRKWREKLKADVAAANKVRPGNHERQMRQNTKMPKLPHRPEVEETRLDASLGFAGRRLRPLP